MQLTFAVAGATGEREHEHGDQGPHAACCRAKTETVVGLQDVFGRDRVAGEAAEYSGRGSRSGTVRAEPAVLNPYNSTA
ncbi:MAG: hypothetical protein AMXMBFR8_17100 [Nevskiales bacterium]